MAAKMGLSPENTDNNHSPPDKSLEEKTVPPDTLMTRLRGRVNQYKPWTDSIKALKMAVLNDKRYSSDALEKASLQSCLDKLHKAMKIVNQQSLVERLEVIARQLGMSFTPPTTPDHRLCLSAEMFVVEVTPDGGGGVKDVKIGHHENPVSCEELIEVLSRGDFDEFVSHMLGLLSIYSLKGDKKQKSKAYLALSSLEADLNVLAQLQSSISGVANYIHKSPLGILLPRKGGHPMKLIYFVSPYDLLCKTTKSSYPMTVEAITENDLGHSVTVCLEPCAALNKLQTMPMISVKTHAQDGKSLPSFQGLNNMNSSSLPASFVLVLPHPVPVSTSVINSIQEVTGLEVPVGEERSLFSLILEQAAQGKITNGTELFVTLPDQQHIYFLHDLADSCLGQPGALITKIPFTHPTSVAKVLNFLRQQLLFNCVVQSLIRPTATHDYKTSLVFELTAISHQHLSVMFEHPLHETMMTVELDLSDITSVKCKVCMGNGDETVCSDDFVSRAFQRCLSIPVTLRTVIHKVREDIKKQLPPEPVLVKHNKPKWKWRSKTVNIPCTNVNSIMPLTALPAQASMDSWTHGHIETRKYFLPFQPNINATNREPPPPAAAEEPVEKPAANPLLATLLDQGSPLSDQHTNPVSESPMLSKLLEEQTPVTVNPPPSFTAPKQRRIGKRKSSKDVLSGKGPKIRPSESDIGAVLSERISTERHGQGIAEKHIDLDSSGGSYEGDPLRPSSVSSVGSIGGQSSTGSIIDLTDIGESHVKKLENSLDSIMMKETRMNLNMTMNMNSQMGGPEGMDFQIPHLGDLHHGQNPHMGDGSEFIPHPQWGSHPTPPRPTSRNSPHHGNMMPKNETASTSLEGNLIGPGDGRDLQGPNPMHCRRNSGHGMRLSGLRRQSSRTSVESNLSDLVSPDIFSPTMKSPGHHSLASPHQMMSPGHSSAHSSTVTSPVHPPISSPSHFLSNIKTEPGNSVYTPPVTSPRSSCDSKGGNYSVTNYNVAASLTPCSTPSPVLYSSGKPSLSALKAQLEMKNDIINRGCLNSQEKEYFKTEERPPTGIMKLRLNMKQYDKQYDTVSPPESDKSRSSMFDFHSDDEEFSLPHIGESMSVVSASPTRLQISNKNKLVHTLKFNKSEKYKRKESKRNSSGDSGKRKREKDESKKEKKRKKVSNNSYPKIKDNAVYKSTTVTVEGMPKLKITKSGDSFESATVVPVESSPHTKEEITTNVKVNYTPHIDKTESSSANSESITVKHESSSVKNEPMPDKLEKWSEKHEKLSEKHETLSEKHESVSLGLAKSETMPLNLAKHPTVTIKNESSVSSEISFTPMDTEHNESKLYRNLSLELSSALKNEHNDNNPLVKLENNLTKEAINLVKVESNPSEAKLDELLDTAVSKDGKDKSLEKNEHVRTSSISDEGIFDKIAAMKTENLPKGTSSLVMDLLKEDDSGVINNKKTYSKSQKAHKAQRSASHSKDDNKISGRTPTLKLKPVVFPSPTSSAQSRTPTTPVMSSSAVHKSVSPSPTSTTIGKIGAVSLATTGSQKQLTQSSKSPQGHKLSSSKGSSGAISTKSTGNLQKTVQITGSSGKNSPVLQTSKSGSLNSNRSVSMSSLNSKVEKSVDKTMRTLSTSSNRTSSPQLGREKESSKSRSSSTSRDRDRERDKSTSSSKTSVPVTSVLTQETAASVLSFLNPKASSIAKLPPIPKKLNSSDSAKNSPTTSSVTTTTPVTSVSTISSSFVTQTTNSRVTNSASVTNCKGKNSNTKPNNLSRQVGNVANSRTGSNSPVNYSTKNNSNSYSNKTNNSNSGSGRTNNASNSSNFNRTNSGHNHTGSSPASRGTNSNSANRANNYVSNSNRGFTSNNSHGGTSNANNVPSNRSKVSGNTTANTHGNRNSTSVPNAPRGPGPPASGNTPALNANSDEHSKTKQSHQAAARSRKGSLSAVIDKLTCKVSVPVSDSNKLSDIKGDKVVIDEPPASPEPDSADNDKRACKTDKAKVVINESPESPEPETVTNSGLSAQQNERTKNHGGIVSIPLDKQISKSPEALKHVGKISSHRQSNGGKEKSKSNKPANLSFTKSSGLTNKLTSSPTTSSQSPMSIPLTPKLKDATSPVWNKSNNKILTKQDNIDSLKNYNEETNGEILEDEDLRIILNQKPPQGYRNTPGVPGSNRSRDSTPTDFSAKKQSPSNVNDKLDKPKENKFVAPVSKSASVDRDGEDLENHIGRRKSRSNSRPIVSPESPCSSPDNGLIIDCDSSPKHLLNKTNSPMCNQDGIKKDLRTSPNFFKSVKLSPLTKFRPSPGTSPTSKDRASESSSPCYLGEDDDLMDLALTGDGKDS